MSRTGWPLFAILDAENSSHKIFKARHRFLPCAHVFPWNIELGDSRSTKDFSHSVTTGAKEGGRRGKQEVRMTRGNREIQRKWVTFKSLHFKWMVGAGWRIESWAFSSPWISHTIHLYANGPVVVQPWYQQKPLWYSKQTFVSLLCCQQCDNEATGTYPAKPCSAAPSERL